MICVPLTDRFADSIDTSATFAIEVTARGPGRSAVLARILRARNLGLEAVLAPDRDLLFDQGRQGAGMQHFGAGVGQFGGLVVGDLFEHSGVRHQARVGRHDAVHVGPDPQLRGVEHAGQDGSRKVRAAAAQGGGLPSTVAPLKPVTMGRTPCSSKGSSFARAFSAVGPISGVALPKTLSVTITSLPLTATDFTPWVLRYSEISSAESFSPDCQGFIHRTRRPLAEHQNSVRDALELRHDRLHARQRLRPGARPAAGARRPRNGAA